MSSFCPLGLNQRKGKFFFHSKIHYELMAFTRLNALYQQENMWLRRNVLVNRGSSDFFTLVLRAWRKHCHSRASMFSAWRVEIGSLPFIWGALYSYHICIISFFPVQILPNARCTEGRLLSFYLHPKCHIALYCTGVHNLYSSILYWGCRMDNDAKVQKQHIITSLTYIWNINMTTGTFCTM